MKPEVRARAQELAERVKSGELRTLPGVTAEELPGYLRARRKPKDAAKGWIDIVLYTEGRRWIEVSGCHILHRTLNAAVRCAQADLGHLDPADDPNGGGRAQLARPGGRACVVSAR